LTNGKIYFVGKEKEILNNLMTKYTKQLFFKWGYGVSQLENFD